MSEHVESIEVDAPVEAVWAVLEDVRRMPELSPSTEEVDAPDRLTAVGQRFEQVVRLGGRRFRSEWAVTAIDPPHHLAIEGKVLPGVRYEMVEDVEPLGTDRCRLRLTMRWKVPFGPVGRLASKLGAERRAIDEAGAVLAGVRRMAEAEVGTGR